MQTEITISVRNLVEFLLRTGDLDNRAGTGTDDAMQEGSRMHRQIQQSAGEGYQSEVWLKMRWNYDKRLPGVTGDATDMLGDHAHVDASHRPFLDNATVIVEGRADGLYYDKDPQNRTTRKARRRPRKGQAVESDGAFADAWELFEEAEARAEESGSGRWTIDEIKTTYRRLDRIRKPEPVHLAQAKCYAYIYAEQHDVQWINIRMTYCNLYDGSIRYFYSEHTLGALRRWFAELMEEYRKWAEYTFLWQLQRTASIRELSFPYPYREGQKRLVAAVYKTVAEGRKLFLEAPTGTGKTISTLYPAVRAMGEGMASRIFYLTAKTITRTAAESAIQEMRGQGLLMKSVVLTARDKICVLGHPDCNPRACPRAKGHYDRINAALFDLLTHEDSYTRENIERYAAQYNVCPFEMGLDIALFADAIIGDYNYLFDPHAYLRRFFGESGDKKGDYIFLVDEAHNLVDRGRSMYSAELCKEDLLLLKRKVKGVYEGIERKLGKCNRAMLKIRKWMLQTDDGMTEEDGGDAADAATEAAPKAILIEKSTALAVRTRNELVKAAGRSEQMAPQSLVVRLKDVDQLSTAVNALQVEIGNVLTQERILELNGRFKLDPLHREKLAVREDLLQFYYDMNHFLLMLEGLDERYIIYSEIVEGKDVKVHLYNADPSANLAKCMERGRASILFSATFLPIQYYKALLGGTKADYEIYAHSVFDPEKRRLLVVQDVTSRFKRRSAKEYERIADCIHDITGERHGNYMVFFPSYSFMQQVADIFEVKYMGRDPSTLRDLPVPSWRRPSATVAGAYIVDEETRGQVALARPEDILPAVQNHSVPGCDITLLRQRANMDEAHREAFLRRFSYVSDEESLLGFCILGGIFSEGIDLRGDALIGAVIVGTGIPQVSAERDLLKRYYDERGENGYDYAYRFPGMNKVLQAAGRVIRTQDDVGIIALLDERFATTSYQSLFPVEWSDYIVTTTQEAPGIVARFWDEWL